MNHTDEQLNIAIAEWMGWEYKDIRLGDDIQDPPPHSTAWHLNGTATLQYPPNYLFDDSPSRQMNEAEARLTDEQHSNYRAILFTDRYNNGEARNNFDAERQRVSATARQRTIAILRTVKPEMFQQ